ncbi:MAG: hypothetical protein EVA92_03320 [SAR86 cluster bacterium]|uniref:Peptidase S9 prolyl oligopeptidase catalytic domain-containing protein n=1 Tax=SAR86 cluster bacterium TaxID=2030880 RepID=A0A520MY89_9GAMM|nr:MAG: hypothetical protein EVA92_03320 [SAR86 cluster bacterium]
MKQRAVLYTLLKNPEKHILSKFLNLSFALLFLSGLLVGNTENNVPLIGSEQMYQALRHNNVDTKLIIYPGENHGLSSPTNRIHRMNSYLDWYARYMKN